MLIFTARRILNSIFVLLASSFIVYMFAASQYDPLAKFRPLAAQRPPGFLDRLAHAQGLDKPLLARYWDWLTHLINFGGSFPFISFNFGNDVYNAPVAPALGQRLEITMRMVSLAIILAVLIAVIAGVISGVRKDKSFDFTVTILTFMLLAVPTFFFAALLKQGAIKWNETVGTPHFFTSFDQSPGIQFYGTQSEILHDQLVHLILPTLSLALLTTCGWIRYQRAAMIDVMDADYMRLARAKGVRSKTVIRRHGLRNALIPLITVMAIDIGALFGGAIITEKVYVWHGMGDYLNQALADQDINKVVGWVMVSAIFVVLFNLFADLLYAALDPRIRLQ